jgi:hypothetical protein
MCETVITAWKLTHVTTLRDCVPRQGTASRATPQTPGGIMRLCPKPTPCLASAASLRDCVPRHRTTSQATPGPPPRQWPSGASFHAHPNLQRSNKTQGTSSQDRGLRPTPTTGLPQAQGPERSDPASRTLTRTLSRRPTRNPHPSLTLPASRNPLPASRVPFPDPNPKIIY